jgi:hypothetical protein
MVTKHRIKVKKEDIFLYVVGNSLFDPIERCIGSDRYEVFDTFIYDNETGRKYNQDEIYGKFGWEELEEIAPKYIFLI